MPDWTVDEDGILAAGADESPFFILLLVRVRSI
jgi:hypothetical protein